MTKTEALTFYQKRAKELNFELPDTMLAKLLKSQFQRANSRTNGDQFRGLLEGIFHIEMPQEHVDTLDPALLNLSPPWIYETMITGMALAKARGTVSEEVADYVMNDAGRNYAKARELEDKAKALDVRLESAADAAG